jgi:DnaJ domain
MSSNLLNFVLWGGFFLVGAGCSTGIIDSDKEDQNSYYNEPWREGESDIVKQKVEERIKKCYSILGLAAGADEEAIQKASKKLLCKCHPDKGGDQEHFRKISNVRDALVAYCEYLSKNNLEHGASNIDLEELIENTDIRQILFYADLGEST